MSGFSKRVVGALWDVNWPPSHLFMKTFVQSDLKEYAYPEYVVPKSIAATISREDVDFLFSVDIVNRKCGKCHDTSFSRLLLSFHLKNKVTLF